MPKKNILLLSDGCDPTEESYFGTNLRKKLSSTTNFSTIKINCKNSAPDAKNNISLIKSAKALIVVRTLPQNWLEWIGCQLSLPPIIYILDDDIEVAENSTDLPDHYRQRLASFAQSGLLTLLNLQSELITTSRFLTEKYSGQGAILIEPTPIYLPNQIANFDRINWVFYHGTKSHLQDLQRIAGAIGAESERHEFKFECLMGKSTPKELTQLKNKRVLDDLSWPLYKVYRRFQRKQIGLSPLFDTPYNRGKSWIKFLDITALGSVGIYSDRPPYNDRIKCGTNGLLCTDAIGDWQEKLGYLLNNPKIAAKIAQNALNQAHNIRSMDTALVTWQKILIRSSQN